MNNQVNSTVSNATNERKTTMTKQTMRAMLKEIWKAAHESSLTGCLVDGDVVFLQTYSKLRKKAIENGWIDEDIVMELDFNDESIFGNEQTRPNIQRMDVIGAAAAVFMSSLSGE